MLVLRACHSPWGTAWVRVNLPSPACISLWPFYSSLLFAKGVTDTGCLLLGAGNLLRNCKSGWNECKSQPDSLHLLNWRFPKMLASFFLSVKGRKCKFFSQRKMGVVWVFVYRVTVRMVCLLPVSQGVFQGGRGSFWLGGVFLFPSHIIQESKSKSDVHSWVAIRWIWVLVFWFFFYSLNWYIWVNSGLCILASRPV